MMEARLAAAQEAYRASVNLVSSAYDVPPEIILRHEGQRNSAHPTEVTLARRAALYLAVVGRNLSLRAVARASGLSPEGVRKALAAIEDRRDDPVIDAQIGQLEEEIAA